MDEARRAALARSALVALVRQHRSHHLGGTDPEVSDLPVGAAATCGRSAFVLVDDGAERALGPVLLWTERAGADHVELWARTGAEDLARRAAFFDRPPLVHRVDGRELIWARPGPRPALPAAPAEAAAFAAVLREAGATVVDDHGVIAGEWEGLEVARVVVAGEEAWLEVGVGQADRELDQVLHGEHSTVQRIRRVVAVVRAHRTAGAAPHPLNRLARERWLRSRLLAQPSLVGAATLAPVAPLRPRRGLVQGLPAPAAGEDPDGRPVVAVASVGVDADLVPEAADLRDRHDPSARLVIAVPPRDRIPPVERLAGRLRGDSVVVGVDPPWS
jgi:hypothetical protein